MSKDPTANTKSETITTAAPILDFMRHLQEAEFPPLPGVGTRWMETMSDMGSQLLTFMSARVHEDVQTQHALLHAKGLAEVQHIQAQFVQKAMNDYIDEMARLMAMGKQAAPDLAKKPTTPKL